MGVQIMKYRATGDCRTPNYKVLGSIAAYEHATAELNLGARSLCIVGGYCGWDWVSIILVEEVYDLIVLNFCQNPPLRLSDQTSRARSPMMRKRGRFFRSELATALCSGT
jgi:hypothetical protein